MVKIDNLEAAADLFSDESRLEGKAEAVYQPESSDELQSIIQECSESSTPVTISAGLTGIAGASVPDGGTVINFKKMDQVLGIYKNPDNEFCIKCQAGVVLGDMRDALHKSEFSNSAEWSDEDKSAYEELKAGPEHIFPVDPTEWSACISGMVACNASGARSFNYGATRDYVDFLKGYLPDGRSFAIKRGENQVSDRNFTLQMDDGSSLSGTVPSYKLPNVKNAAGYFAADNMDLIDLLIGNEGTLCILSEIGLRLVRKPEQIMGIICFTRSEEDALNLIHYLRDSGEVAKPLALEYFDHKALDMLRQRRDELEGSDEIPDLPEHFHTALYVEFAGVEDDVDEAVMLLAEKLEELNVEEDATWMATEAHEHERLKSFRHAIPETVNSYIGQLKQNNPGITKLGTDMAVPDSSLDEIVAFYREKLDAAELNYVMFGHIGDNHLHVNIIPHNEDEYASGKQIYKEFAEKAVSLGGTVSAEHGVGKLKKFLLPVMYGDEGIAEMKKVKAVFDPNNILNKGNLFD
ncbi:MAG: FAD-binding oxidoreductase [Planctomycetota bacterium]|jgi:D-lactate dehydrogenase (cytochrome)